VKQSQHKTTRLKGKIFDNPDLIFKIYNNSKNLNFVIDSEGILRSVNQAFEKELGNSRQLINIISIADLLDPGSVDIVNNELKKIISKSYCFIDEVRLKDKFQSKKYELKLSLLKNDLILGNLNESIKENLKDELNLFRSSLEVIKNAVVITDADGKIEWVNSEFLKITQYSLPDVIGKNPRILKSGIQDIKFYEEMWDTIKNGRVWKGKLFNKRKDGSVYLDGQTIIPFKNENNIITHYIAIKSDLSKQAYTEEKIFAQNQLLNRLSDAVITTDEDLKITDFNKGIEKIFEVQSESLPGTNAMDIVQGSMHDSRKNKILNSLIKNGHIKFDTIIESQTAYPKYIQTEISALKDNSDSISGYIWLFKETCEEVEFISGIKKSNKFLNSVFDSIAEPILIFDKQLKIIASNKSLLSRLKINSNQIYQKKIGEAFNLPQEYARRAEDHITGIFKNNKPQKFIDRFDHLENPRIIEAIFFPISTGHTEVDFVGQLYRDITEQKFNEKSDIESDKLAEIGKMAAYLLHQMKTPLNSIKMNIDMLSKYEVENPAREKSIKLLQKEMARLSRFMKEILQFSQTKDAKPIKMNINCIINDIQLLLNPLLEEKSIKFSNNVENRNIIGIKDKLITVFYHLIENSIESIESRGKITLSSSYNENNHEYSLFIEDTGSGIKDAERIFEPFFTTKKEGTGLGLSIIRDILEANRAGIRLVKSIPGSTIFEIKFYCEL